MATDAGAKVEAVEGFTQAVTLVKQERVDATVNDNLAVLEYVKTTQDKDVKIAAETGDTSEQVFALRPEDGALRDAINQSLDELRADGTLAEISQRYFDTDVSTGEETATTTRTGPRCRAPGSRSRAPSDRCCWPRSRGPSPSRSSASSSAWRSRWSWR